MSDAEKPDSGPAADEGAAADAGTAVEDPYEDLTIPPGAVVEPGTTLVNETGSWREERPMIDHEPCTGCGLCVTYCPDGAVVRVDDLSDALGYVPGDRRPVPRAAKHVGRQQVAIDYRYCKGCGICAEECPSDVIEMVPEVK